MEPKAVLIDSGSDTVKVGIAGDTDPRIVFPLSVVGENHPIQRGFVTNWADVETLWAKSFSELKVAAESQPCLLTEAPLTSRPDREKMVEIMMEKLKVPKTYLAMQPVLSLYAAGKMQGTVIEFGHGNTSVVPVAEGFAIPSAIVQLGYGGQDLTEELRKMATKRASFDVSDEQARELKHNLCFVSLDCDKEVKEEAKHKLPDGREVSLAEERYQCPEALFRPSLIGKDGPGIHQATIDANMKCDEKIRKDVFGDMVIAGGGSLFPKLGDRIRKELSSLESGFETNIVEPEYRKNSVFIGASILSAMPTFQDMWITKKSYDEEGAGIVHRVCL